MYIVHIYMYYTGINWGALLDIANTIFVCYDAMFNIAYIDNVRLDLRS